MILIIAEKPSLARNICAGIGKMQRRDGYFEGNGYLVSWALGHLFQLYDIEDYTGDYGAKWSLEGLPFYPESFSINSEPAVRKERSTRESAVSFRC
ncbi:MAG: hypothetical protein E7525_06075 [Ruminococcaceae bacterium]|nr:hypothetical protein [Oscillospiraceae bacterium]